MKNILQEKPSEQLYGRPLFNTLFVADDDLINKNVLDIGCGFGWFILHAEKKGAQHITGVEITEQDLRPAKEHIKSERVSFHVGSAIELPFENNCFDTIVSWEVIEHIPKGSERSMFSEANRVLKPGGVFYLSTPFLSLRSTCLDPAWWLIGHRHYSLQKLTQSAQAHGFKLEQVVINGGWWEIVGMWNLYIAKWIFRRKPFFEDIIRKKQDEEFSRRKGFTNIFIKLRKTNG